MEVRMHPRSDSNQRCLSFSLSVSPRCRVFTYRDHLGNHIHHFDIPGRHGQLVIVAESVVEHQPLAAIPGALGPGAWQELDALVAEGDYWEMLLPSEFAQPTPELLQLAKELDVVRRDDPLQLLHEINQRHVRRRSAMRSRRRGWIRRLTRRCARARGVCQDLAHIMIALVRHVGIPCRYVSGYLYHGQRGSRPLDLQRDACVGRGVFAGAGVGGVRSDECAGGAGPAYSHGAGTRLCGCAADAGTVSRADRERAACCGAGDCVGYGAGSGSGAADSGGLVDAGGEGAGTTAAGGAVVADSAIATAAAVRQGVGIGCRVESQDKG